MLMQHFNFSCIVGDRSFSAAAASCKFSCIVGDKEF